MPITKLPALLCLLLWSSTGIAADLTLQHHGVILQYHHVSTETPASTSVSPEQFAEHMQYLAENHNVISLQDMLYKLSRHQPLPDNAVAITFDDGYTNILQNAHPILQRHGFNYTVFINPALIGNESQQLSWKQVKQMQKDGVWFANHTNHHQHLLSRGDMSKAQWLANLKEEILSAESKLQEELGYSLRYLAYPYGEYNSDLQALVKDLGFIGLGQQSGAVAPFSDMTALPRFPAAGVYANLKTLKVKLSSLAMPSLYAPLDPELALDNLQPTWTTKIDTNDIRPAQLACYFQGKKLQPVWEMQDVFSLTMPTPLSAGRARVNCTAPSKQDPSRYYWHSQPFFVPTNDGRWLD
ncbi:polysaccharide deacetylase family protein [Bowmanella sp. Y26]|uniref:Polysaccharide deacetylase family protein n=1 Tax=Bowmanella yangjiangensis TaxID=2811230 RepID=A0ABS3CPX0_9ALTE|nr:polysaccharide deacetylase family protein [Bowmanella yangjiangensis]MBN7819139.1 polysaccharide deacetylase family protein [Bowmanella yangjiangensis]MBT1065816.1 polysaccharide deacetylase family protein [Bowmanella yangjiangensis]